MPDLRLAELIKATLDAVKRRNPPFAAFLLVMHEGGSVTLAARSINAFNTDELLTTVLGVICAMVDEGKLIGGWAAFDEQLKIFREMRSARPAPTVVS